MRFRFAVLPLLVLCSCDSGDSQTRLPDVKSDATAAGTLESDRQSAVYEALIRWYLSKARPQRNDRPLFISIAGQDPDESLLQRFQGHTPPVEAASKRTGGGILLRIGDTTWLDDHTAEVRCEVPVTWSAVVRLERTEGSWKVVQRRTLKVY